MKFKESFTYFVLTVVFSALITFGIQLAGCSPVEQQAYQTVVAANAFLKSMRATHPECAKPQIDVAVCTALSRATSAKNSLIDAVEVYCAGPDFAGGGKCNPPAKGTPAATQITAKLQAAIKLYEQAETDLKGVVK